MNTPPSVRPRHATRVSAFADQDILLIGVGGSGLSGLARLLNALGARCVGSDQTQTEITESLVRDGIAVIHGDDACVLPTPCNLVIASAAIRENHPQLAAARVMRVPIISYAEALGRAQAERTGISIAGTHGKSTTTAMLCHVLLQCGLDPSFIVGATCEQIGGGSRSGAALVPGVGPLAGQPGLLAAEACEFNRSFHHHQPVLGLINNVEEDHLDVYGTLDHIIESFHVFAQRLPAADAGGYLLIAHDGAHRRTVTAGLSCVVETFGYSPTANYQVVTDAAVRRVGLLRDGIWLAQWTNTLPGEHNALNAAAAAILAARAGADWEAIGSALDSFRGLDRRMQRLGERAVRGGQAVVYDDYGHHPTEIDMTLRALRVAEKPKRLICVFQPHQHSRTRFLLDEFAQSFSSADVVIVPDIFFVRDSEIEKTRVSAADLVDRLRTRGIAAMHVYPFAAIVEQLEVMCQGGDLLVIMGAGPVWKVGRSFLGASQETG